MLKSHEKFYSIHGKRLVLIVDDELINRELLKLILEDEFETITAPDGDTAFEIIQEKHETLSLILLDLLMPGMHGLDLIRHLKEDPVLRQIPVIVLTADSKAEVQSLKLGAVDFISKPYPDQEVILARVRRSIELSEDREIIEYTERDGLTGLYNREFFFRYAQQYDQLHPEKDMDAIVVDVHHFRMVGGTFKHSPVFRVGGDEFVAILQGPDYEQRVALMSEMMERNRKNRENGGVVIACGASAWNGAEDNRFEAVFDRADTEMYENKTELKTRK